MYCPFVWFCSFDQRRWRSKSKRVVGSWVGSSALIHPGSSRHNVDVAPDQSALLTVRSTSYWRRKKMRGRFTPLCSRIPAKMRSIGYMYQFSFPASPAADNFGACFISLVASSALFVHRPIFHSPSLDNPPKCLIPLWLPVWAERPF